MGERKLNRRDFLRLSAGAAAGALLAGWHSSLQVVGRGRAVQPNILFILSDQQRWDTLGCYGQELDVTPDKATRALYEQLLQAGLEPELAAEPEAAITELVGRDDEWDQLKRAWQTAARGRTSFVLISGEAGTGKSRLAAELLKWAQRQGIAAVTTRSYEAEGELAYAPLLTWLRSPLLQAAWNKLDDAALSELARLLPELLVERLDLPAPLPLTQSWQRQRLFQALAQAVLALDRPLLLHIDDLQWCDQETLEWLHYLLRFDPQAPLLLVGAYRPV